MINYLKSEHYRLIRQKATFLIPVLLLVFMLTMLGLTFYSGLGDPDFPYNTTRFIYLTSRISFVIPLLALPFLVNYLFGSEFENGTFKNSVSYGFKRYQLFWGKLIVAFSYSWILIVSVFVPYVFAVEHVMENSGPAYLFEFLEFSAYMTLMLAGTLFLTLALRFLLKSSSAYFGVFYLLVLGASHLVAALRNQFPIFEVPLRLFPFYHVAAAEVVGWGYAIAIFLIYSTLSVLIGLRSFTRSDL